MSSSVRRSGGAATLCLLLLAALAPLPAASRTTLLGDEAGGQEQATQAAGASHRAGDAHQGAGSVPDFGTAEVIRGLPAGLLRRLLQVGATAVPEDYCSKKRLADGAYAHPDAGVCNLFVICSDALTYTFSCASDLAFNPDTRICDWPANIPSCRNQTSPSSTPGATPLPTPTPAPAPLPGAISTAPPPAPFYDDFRGGVGAAPRPPAYSGFIGDPPPPTRTGGAGLPQENDFRGSSTPPAPDPLLDFRNSKPYPIIPGYGGDDFPYLDPSDLADDLAGDDGGGAPPPGNGGSGGPDLCASDLGAVGGNAMAEYSALFEAPACDARGRRSCAASGLDGKGLGGEASSPNTLYGECSDGESRLFTGRGYVAAVELQSAQRDRNLRSGSLATITARVVCDPTVPDSLVDFFYTSEATMVRSGMSPGARHPARDGPAGAGAWAPRPVVL
ncbi:hypothetical protein TSOC_002855 [Tetrabaena socialis]|uniref:Chitin-binding type-2 domain-containing protein n=1 Tax=Tetrabaena socialis TaxID=47790 RepID=A0A2J8AD28_9CHLO|nr:hypothetical protein TSOC_002855 [Tetrabaena socialis]|eukprot:PNH10417.1 hypothetical protein TSOC_002855 [Tetrabaena socialis]